MNLSCVPLNSTRSVEGQRRSFILICRDEVCCSCGVAIPSAGRSFLRAAKYRLTLAAPKVEAVCIMRTPVALLILCAALALPACAQFTTPSQADQATPVDIPNQAPDMVCFGEGPN